LYVSFPVAHHAQLPPTILRILQACRKPTLFLPFAPAEVQRRPNQLTQRVGAGHCRSYSSSFRNPHPERRKCTWPRDQTPRHRWSVLKWQWAMANFCFPGAVPCTSMQRYRPLQSFFGLLDQSLPRFLRNPVGVMVQSPDVAVDLSSQGCKFTYRPFSVPGQPSTSTHLPFCLLLKKPSPTTSHVMSAPDCSGLQRDKTRFWKPRPSTSTLRHFPLSLLRMVSDEVNSHV